MSLRSGASWVVMERSKISSGCSLAIKQDRTRATRRKGDNCGRLGKFGDCVGNRNDSSPHAHQIGLAQSGRRVIVEGPHDPRGQKGDAASGEVEGWVGHAATSKRGSAPQ